MKTIEQLFEIAGIKDIDKAMSILNEDDFRTILYKIDKWMPSDSELQDQFDALVNQKEILQVDIEELANFLYVNSDEEVLKKYGFRGNWQSLANYIIQHSSNL